MHRHIFAIFSSLVGLHLQAAAENTKSETAWIREVSTNEGPAQAAKVETGCMGWFRIERAAIISKRFAFRLNENTKETCLKKAGPVLGQHISKLFGFDEPFRIDIQLNVQNEEFHDDICYINSKFESGPCKPGEVYADYSGDRRNWASCVGYLQNIQKVFTFSVAQANPKNCRSQIHGFVRKFCRDRKFDWYSRISIFYQNDGSLEPFACSSLAPKKNQPPCAKGTCKLANANLCVVPDCQPSYRDEGEPIRLDTSGRLHMQGIAAPVGKSTACSACTKKCNSGGVPILTPNGYVAIESLKKGDLVFSLNNGRRVVSPVLRTQKINISKNHIFTQLKFANGSVIRVSPEHPTIDHAPIDRLVVGQWMGPEKITDIQHIISGEEWTYDILPDSDSGAYLAGGIWMKSTMAP